jgi:hypothetical protein
MTVQNLYTQYLEGKVSKQKFLYEVRRDQNLTMISPSNSFDDVVKILKNKSIISEKAYKESTGKQEVEVIAKTIDMVNPYEYTRGMEFELNIMDVPSTSGDLSEDSILKAQKKVLANLTKNPQYYYEKLNGKGEVSDKWVEVTKKEMDKIGKGKAVKGLMREGYTPNQKVTFTNTNDGNKYEGTVVQDLGNGRFTFRAEDGKVYGSEGLGSNWKIEMREVSSDTFKSAVDVARNRGENERASKLGSTFLNAFVGKPLMGGKISKIDIQKPSFGDYFDATLEVLVPTQGTQGMYDKPKYLYYDVENDDWNMKGKGLEVTRQDARVLSQIAVKLNPESKYKQGTQHFDIIGFNEEISRPGYNEDGTPKSNDEISDDEREAFYNDSAFLDEHGQYASRVADVNADSSPLKEKKLRIYEKYAQKMNKTVDEVKCMVDEAIALKDKAGNIQYAKDSTEASTIEKNAKSKGITLTKTAV